MRVVADSNVYISAAAFGGVPLLVLHCAERGEIELYASAAIQEEVHRVLREKMHWLPARIAEAFAPIWELAHFVKPKREVHVSRDEADNRILECAVAGDAEMIVTGDRDLLDLSEYEGIRIVTPRQFIVLHGI
jgi:putative PIN family toxin of toxin-antitoxin system